MTEPVLVATLSSLAVLGAAVITAVFNKRIRLDLVRPKNEPRLPDNAEQVNTHRAGLREVNDEGQAATRMQQQLGADYVPLCSSRISEAPFLSDKYVVDLLADLRLKEQPDDQISVKQSLGASQ